MTNIPYLLGYQFLHTLFENSIFLCHLLRTKTIPQFDSIQRKLFEHRLLSTNEMCMKKISPSLQNNDCNDRRISKNIALSILVAI